MHIYAHQYWCTDQYKKHNCEASVSNTLETVMSVESCMTVACIVDRNRYNWAEIHEVGFDKYIQYYKFWFNAFKQI